MIGQIHRVNIYSAMDDYTIPVVTNLRVRVTHNTLNTLQQVLKQEERRVMLAGRRLQYPGDYIMPDDARVEWLDDPDVSVGTSMWNVIEDTAGTWQGPNGYNVIKTCQLEKIDTAD